MTKIVTAPGTRSLDAQRPVGLELEQRRLAVGPQPVDLGVERPVAVSDVVDPLEELAGDDPAVELLAVEEPVVDAVLLAGPLWPRGRRDGERELCEPRQDELDERALARARRAGDHEDGLRGGVSTG